MELIIQSQEGGISRIAVEGELTQRKISRAQELLPELLGANVYAGNVLVDSSTTNFIDSSGINWLLGCHKNFEAEGGRMIIHSVPELADKVLKILRLESVFEIVASKAAATTAIQSPRSVTKDPDEDDS